MFTRFTVYAITLATALLLTYGTSYARPVVSTIIKIPLPDGRTVFAFPEEIEDAAAVTVNCTSASGDGHDIVRTLHCDGLEIACAAQMGWSCEANQNGAGVSCSC